MATVKPEILKYFSDLIERETGIVYNANNSLMLENRLRDLARSLGSTDVDALWAEVQSKGLTNVQREMVLDLATNNETSFYRDPEVFEFFKDHFLKGLPTSCAQVRIWCAACSTGQEPYSLSMILNEYQKTPGAKPYSILATDFSERVLKQAQSGVYSQLEVQRGLSALSLVRCFEQLKSENTVLPKFKIKQEFMRNLSFRRLNLLENWGNHGPFEIIFCRNVLIYQDVENKKKVIAKMAKLLTPGGYLVLGGAESLLGLSSDFEMRQFGKACVYQIKDRIMASA